MSEKLVRYALGARSSITDERFAEMVEQSKLPVDTSDIPEMTDEEFNAAVKSRFHKARKQQITALVDADVLQWLKAQGKGYQSRMNAILRDAMLHAIG